RPSGRCSPFESSRFDPHFPELNLRVEAAHVDDVGAADREAGSGGGGAGFGGEGADPDEAGPGGEGAGSGGHEAGEEGAEVGAAVDAAAHGRVGDHERGAEVPGRALGGVVEVEIEAGRSAGGEVRAGHVERGGGDVRAHELRVRAAEGALAQL